jgi:hypothetical protein
MRVEGFCYWDSEITSMQQIEFEQQKMLKGIMYFFQVPGRSYINEHVTKIDLLHFAMLLMLKLAEVKKPSLKHRCC